jgi:hypothetical protein
MLALVETGVFMLMVTSSCVLYCSSPRSRGSCSVRRQIWSSAAPKV